MPWNGNNRHSRPAFRAPGALLNGEDLRPMALIALKQNSPA